MAKLKSLESAKIKLSAALTTFNEEVSLGSCLESVKGLAGEIIVVDGSSSDRTVEIAKSFGAKVIITENEPIFHINKQKAIDECRGEWILLLDADEIIPPELAEEIKEVVRKDSEETVAFWVKRKKMFLGRWMKKGGQYPDPVIRLFKKGKSFLPCKSVHEQMEVQGKVGWLQNAMIHLPNSSFAFYLTKDNRYSTLTALEMADKKVPLNFWSFLKYVVCEPNRIFFSLYFRHKGFLDGFPGFVFACYSGLHRVSAYIKYWEMKNNSERDIKKDWV